MILVALEEAAQKGELLIVDGGMLRYHRRRDGVHTIRELIVLPQHRRKGIGTRLVMEVICRARGFAARARCPKDYAANAFWAALAFTLIEEKDGINLWQRPANP